ncbi:MAG TPA: RNA polymerase sigma factor [Candidatus Acidoferrales bacterium]|nr:RNA polymerase sigma factor [Candidatus Acidoferrales bacterium]
MPREGPAESPTSRLEEFLSSHARLVEELFRKTDAARWGLTHARFAKALLRSAAHRFPEACPAAAELTGYLESLHLEDLALACACSDGNEQAWEHFIERYRQDLYAAARAIIGQGDEARARDLADSIYAELYGLAPRGEGAEAKRRSLFDYFDGRSKLSTWLRAVLARRHVDALRASQRTESLDENEEPETLGGPKRDAPPDPDRARYVALLHVALTEVLTRLHARDRLRLACYYVQELTLAQIGRILGEHEATTSRHLDRIRRELRQSVEAALRDGRVSVGGAPPAARLSEAQIHLCFEYALEQWPFDLTGALSRETPRPKLAEE